MIGTTRVLTSQANVGHLKHLKLLQVVTDELCSRVAKLFVVADAEILEQ